jgi:hypothetical protein
VHTRLPANKHGVNAANRRGSFRLLCLALLVSWATLAAAGCNFGASTAAGTDSGTRPAFEAGSANTTVPDATSPSEPDATTVDGPAPTFTIGGTVTGLVGTGFVLRDNGADDLAISGNGPFTFKTHVAAGGAYAVTAYAQPSSPTQVCTVKGGTGTATANVTGVQVTCATNSYPVGGTLVGLAAASTGGVVLADAVAGGVTDTVAVNQNGSFTFPTKVPSGAKFAVSMKTNPTTPVQTCNVSGGTGTIVNGPVTSVVVNCATNAYALGGTVSGLTGQGLVLTDGTTTVAVSSNGSFAFSDVIPNGTSYAVTVQTQPTGPSQTCSLTGGTGIMGTANVTSVSVSCVTAAYAVGGTVSGLTGSGLVLQDNGGETLPVMASGTFEFPMAVASGSPYVVTVKTQPTTPWETCTLTGGAGNVGGGPVTSIQVTCVPDQYTVQVVSMGVVGKGLTLTLNGAETLPIPANSTYTFNTNVASGTTYTVAIGASPTTPTQTCTIGNGSAVVAGSAIDVTVSCSTQAYPVGGTLSGLTGTGLVLTNNGGDKLTILPGATTFTMPTLVASGAAYDIEVATAPTGPSQTCTVTGNKGTIVAGGVNSVVVNCGTNSFTVGGNVTGLAGKGLVLLNGTDKVSVTAQGSFAFPTPVVSGGSYDVTIGTQPTTPTQICTITGGGPATVNSANVTTIAVACVTQSYSVGGTVANLAGNGLVLEDNGADDLAVTTAGASTPFTFKTVVASNAPYAVTVKAQPTSPWQTCTPASTTGTVGGANVSVPLNCATNTYSVSASVTGLSGSGLILTLNGGNPTSASTNGTTYNLGSLASGTKYAVAVLTQPSTPSQSCTVTAPGTVIAGAAVTVAVACSTLSYSVGGTVSGLTGSGLLLTNSDNGDTVSIPVGATSFKFPTPVPSGQAFNVGQPTVQPSNPTQSCTVAAGAGSVGSGNVTGISVSCQTNAYTIGGTITLSNDKTLGNLALTLNNAETIHPTSTGFVFATHIPSGGSYSVTVTQPTVPTQSCVITNNSGSGSVVNSNINNVTITCTTTAFPVNVTLTGLIAGNSSVVLQDNLGDNLTMTANTTAAFTTSVLSGQAYSVTVLKEPASPAQTCVPQAPSAGTIGAGPASVKVVCTPNPVTVSVTVYNGATCTNCENEACPGSILLIDLQGTKNASTSVSATGASLVSFSVPYGDSEGVVFPGDPSNATGATYCECALTGSPVTGPTNWCPLGSVDVGNYSCVVPVIPTQTMTGSVSATLYCYYYTT